MFIKEELFEKEVPKIQFSNTVKDCPHKNEVRVMGADSETAFIVGSKKLKYFLCLDCGHIRQSRTGPHICVMCEGKMDIKGYIPGQGGGMRVYRCEWCGHEEESP
ncbi:hypothetical protein KKG15_00330 [Patescibacteria group bacterium]|nr:hypothetical protein [Patescibacteria group bacterium]